MLFRRRDLLVCQRTQTINALRGHLAEFGIAAPQGEAHVARLAQALGGSGIAGSGALLFDRIVALDAEIAGLAKEVGEAAGRDDDAARLMIIPGGEPITTMALRDFAPPLESFRRGRDLAAWLGLVPRQHTTGSNPRLGRILKRGQRDLRRLLIIGAMEVVRHANRRGSTPDTWLAGMLACKPRMLIAVALANRMARIAKAVEAEIPGSCRRLMGRHAARSRLPGDVPAFGSMQMRDAALELVDRGTGKARRSICLDRHEECMADTTVIEIDPDTEMVAGRGILLVADCDDLCVRVAIKQGADLVHGPHSAAVLLFCVVSPCGENG